jgi:hypothetical protein
MSDILLYRPVSPISLIQYYCQQNTQQERLRPSTPSAENFYVIDFNDYFFLVFTLDLIAIVRAKRK